MDNPQSSLLEILVPGFRMHTQMFNNMFEGITEEDALKRINGNTNHVVWMAGNLVDCRYWTANVLGLKDKDPFLSFFEDAKSLDDNVIYPSLSQIKKEWHNISPKLYRRLLEVDDAELEAGFDFGEMEVSFIKSNILNAVGMGFDRESYLLGQLGLMRKLLGLPGVNYNIDHNLNY